MSKLKQGYTQPSKYSYGQPTLPLDDDDLGFYYDNYNGDYSDSDVQSIYNNRPVRPADTLNPTSPDVYPIYYHARSRSIVPPSYNAAYAKNFRPVYHRQGLVMVPPASSPLPYNSVYKMATVQQPSQLNDKSVYVSYQNPAYHIEGTGQCLAPIQTTDTLPKRRTKVYTLRKKKSSNPTTVPTPRYVRPVTRRTSVLSMALATKMEPIRSRPVYTQTTPSRTPRGGTRFQCISSNPAVIGKSITNHQIRQGISNQRESIPLVQPRLSVPIATTYKGQKTEDPISDPPSEQLRLNLDGLTKSKHVNNGIEIEMSKFEKMFVKEQSRKNSSTNSSKNSSPKLRTQSYTVTSQLQNASKCNVNNAGMDKKESEQFSSELDNLIRDMSEPKEVKKRQGSDQAKESYHTPENKTSSQTITLRGAQGYLNDVTQSLPTSMGQKANLYDVASQPSNHAFPINLKGYQRNTSSGLGFNARCSQLTNKLEEAALKIPSVAEMELHRSKSIIIGLIDKELSKSNILTSLNNNISSSMKIDARDAINYVQQSDNVLKEMEMTEAITNTLVSTLFPNPNDCIKYLEWLKKMRRYTIQNIQREINHLQELDETMYP